jgi:drug/metabolite transporter (DMT)-like permease
LIVDRAQIGDLLALVNASPNATSAVALFTGFYFVKRRSLRMHRRAMLTALSASGLFLVFYLTRVAFTGTHEFAGEGAANAVYLSILFSRGGIVPPATPSSWALVVVVGVVTIALAQFLFFDALSRIEASRASLATPMEPGRGGDPGDPAAGPGPSHHGMAGDRAGGRGRRRRRGTGVGATGGRSAR